MSEVRDTFSVLAVFSIVIICEILVYVFLVYMQFILAATVSVLIAI